MHVMHFTQKRGAYSFLTTFHTKTRMGETNPAQQQAALVATPSTEEEEARPKRTEAMLSPE